MRIHSFKDDKSDRKWHILESPTLTGSWEEVAKLGEDPFDG